MLLNASSKKKIIERTKLADNSFSRFKGLMFEKKENFNYALIFDLPSVTKFGASVHMMFVFFAIGIVFLDEKRKVLDKTVLKPWMLNYTPKEAAKYFIELPEELILDISVGDKLEWK